MSGSSGSRPADEPGPVAPWAWVRAWHRSQEPPAWAPGIAVAFFVALLVGVTLAVLTAGLAGVPILAAAADVLVIAGLAPAIWMSRRLPVLRWLAAGCAVGLLLGIVAGWIVASGA